MQVITRAIDDQTWALMSLASLLYKRVETLLVIFSDVRGCSFLMKYAVNEQVAECLRHVDLICMVSAKISICY